MRRRVPTSRSGGPSSAGVPLPGLRFLATNLAAVGTGTLPPPPRHPADEPGSLVAAVRDNPLLILDDVDAAEVAAAVAALVDDGRRVIVTASDSKALAAVRGMLPPAVIDRVVDALPALAPADLHRLRGLLATSTPARRARAGQQLPDLGACPAVAEVAQLCATAVRTGSPGVELIADVLRELDAERRAAVTAIAQCVQRALTVLGAHTEPWVWDLLGDLVHGRRRSEFDRLVQSTAQALATIDDGRGDPPVRATGPLPEGSVDALVAYLDFLENGGRARSYFRATVQRDVEPVLRVLRVGDHEPATSDELRIVLTHFELGERVVAVDGDCATLGLPTPQNPDELTALSRALTDIGAAARSVAALRHDVLFLHPGSPVSVPDVAAAEQLAAAVLDYGEFGSPRQAAERLDAMADDLAALLPPQATAPEHARAVEALRARDPVGYAEAIDELVGAHLARRDEQRTADLLTGLGSDSLARAWTPTDDGAPVRCGPGLVHADRAAARRAAPAGPGGRRGGGRRRRRRGGPCTARRRRPAAAGRGRPGGPGRRNDPAQPAVPGVRAGHPRPVDREAGSGRPAHRTPSLRSVGASRSACDTGSPGPDRGSSRFPDLRPLT